MKLIKDIVHDSIELNDLEGAIISQSFFKRLHHIKQLGQVQFVYPSATHTRYSHSIGTMHLAGLAYQYSLINTDQETLIDYSIAAYETLLDVMAKMKKAGSIEFSIWIEINAVFNPEARYAETSENSRHEQINLELEAALENIHKIIGLQERGLPLPQEYIMGERTRNSSASDMTANANTNNVMDRKYQNALLFEYIITRLAGLLHDVGHLPYSHLLEEAVTEYIYARHSDEEDGAQQENIPIHLHERITELLLKKLVLGAAEEYGSKYAGDSAEIQIKQLLSLVVITLPKIITGEGYIHLHKIINNAIDVDKLDYIVRDGIHTGTGNAYSEALRVIKTMVLKKVKDNSSIGKYNIAVSAKAIKNTENILKERASLYKTVIGHHKSRKYEMYYKILLSNVINNINKIKSDMESEKDISNEESEAQQRLPKEANIECGPFFEKINPLYELIKIIPKLGNDAIDDQIAIYVTRLTDEWLESWLREIYYAMLSRKTSSGTNIYPCIPYFREYHKDIIGIAQELFDGGTNHYSIWKRDYVFKKYVDNIRDSKEAEDMKRRIEYIYEVLIKSVNHGKGKNINHTRRKETMDYKLSVAISNMKQWSYMYYKTEIFNENKKSFYAYMLGEIKERIAKECEGIQISAENKYDILIYPNDTKIFVASAVVNIDKGLIDIDQVTPINDILMLEKSYTVPYYAYATSRIYEQIGHNYQRIFDIMTETIINIYESIAKATEQSE